MAKQESKRMAEIMKKESAKSSTVREPRKLDTIPSKGVKKLATTPNVSERMSKDPGKMVDDAPRNRMAAFYARRIADRMEDKTSNLNDMANEAPKLRSFADSVSREAYADEQAYDRYKKLTKKVEVPKIETTTKKKKK